MPEGKQVKNRLHLDLVPVEGSRDEEPARLLELGDPEGDEFCILRSEAEREAAAPEA